MSQLPGQVAYLLGSSLIPILLFFCDRVCTSRNETGPLNSLTRRRRQTQTTTTSLKKKSQERERERVHAASCAVFCFVRFRFSSFISIFHLSSILFRELLYFGHNSQESIGSQQGAGGGGERQRAGHVKWNVAGFLFSSLLLFFFFVFFFFFFLKLFFFSFFVR